MGAERGNVKFMQTRHLEVDFALHGEEPQQEISLTEAKTRCALNLDREQRRRVTADHGSWRPGLARPSLAPQSAWQQEMRGAPLTPAAGAPTLPCNLAACLHHQRPEQQPRRAVPADIHSWDSG